MPYREEHYNEGHTPKAYPTVKLDQPIHIVTVGLAIEGDDPVGYLIWQGPALEWYTNVGQKDGWRYGVRAQVEGIIADGLDRGLEPNEVWGVVLDTAPIALVAHEDDPERFFDALRKRWAALND
ncbi:hypothetical protein PBI_JOHANN_8 [Microbacterium phage Johann]|uniref:Uncharacterized protein n=2 Tax=Goodmanvirus goodman TaxID=2734238 RepID=A0A3G3LZL0_9CAUD|nr:hypothetical protein HOU56_gp08 [Microbacterium phage Goodman]AYQ99464.1 hypothetical protein PBI_GOODMAN_8 [Microbacterium phage Goodman]AYQ99632.1 hypothetical protein PBI_JOHANN_8 [Microbacterium phage Johann]